MADTDADLRTAITRLADATKTGGVDALTGPMRNVEVYLARLVEEISSGRAQSIEEIRLGDPRAGAHHCGRSGPHAELERALGARDAPTRKLLRPQHLAGFVDALSSLLIIIIFLLTLFALAHVTASALIERRDEALDRLRTQLSELSEVLRLEKQTSADLRRSLSEMSASLQATQTERDRLRSERGDLEARLNAATGALSSEQELSGKQRDEIAELNNAISAMRDQMARLEALLSDAEAKAKADQVQIADLGKRLNVALAGASRSSHATARSSSAGCARCWATAPTSASSATASSSSRRCCSRRAAPISTPTAQADRQLAEANLKEISAKIPTEINWVLRVDGHTDKRPIATPQFPSNWELSTARAIAVVKFLIAQRHPARSPRRRRLRRVPADRSRRHGRGLSPQPPHRAEARPSADIW